MTMTEREKLEYWYGVYITQLGRAELVGWIFAKAKEMPFVPECYGIFGMRQVVVFPISMEVLR